MAVDDTGPLDGPAAVLAWPEYQLWLDGATNDLVLTLALALALALTPALALALALTLPLSRRRRRRSTEPRPSPRLGRQIYS